MISETATHNMAIIHSQDTPTVKVLILNKGVNLTNHNSMSALEDCDSSIIPEPVTIAPNPAEPQQGEEIGTEYIAERSKTVTEVISWSKEADTAKNSSMSVQETNTVHESTLPFQDASCTGWLNVFNVLKTTN